jgi:hypothetical protein
MDYVKDLYTWAYGFKRPGLDLYIEPTPGIEYLNDLAGVSRHGILGFLPFRVPAALHDPFVTLN